MEYIEMGDKKLGISAIIISVFLLFSIGSFIVGTMQVASAQLLPDHSYTPHTGVIHQTPERLTLVPLGAQK
jgi:hypothetical protein